MQYILIAPESGITPQNLSVCFTNGVMMCNSVKHIKTLEYEPSKHIICIDPEAGITYEDIKNIQGNILFVANLESVKVI